MPTNRFFFSLSNIFLKVIYRVSVGSDETHTGPVLGGGVEAIEDMTTCSVQCPYVVNTSSRSPKNVVSHVTGSFADGFHLNNPQ